MNRKHLAINGAESPADVTCVEIVLNDTGQPRAVTRARRWRSVCPCHARHHPVRAHSQYVAIKLERDEIDPVLERLSSSTNIKPRFRCTRI